jgi:hypothetical protein
MFLEICCCCLVLFCQNREILFQATFIWWNDNTPECMKLEEMYAMVGSSYEGFDAIGLFWSQPQAKQQFAANFFQQSLGAATLPTQVVLNFDLYVDGRHASTTQLKIGNNIYCQQYRTPFVGALCAAAPLASVQQRPTIVVVGGSEGGFDTLTAILLTSDAFNVVALGYFGAPGLPPQLENIPLEYFERAVGFLRTLPQIGIAKLALFGTSRGGELALQM